MTKSLVSSLYTVNEAAAFVLELLVLVVLCAWGFSTAQMVESAKGTPGFANAPHVVTVPGGVPVWSVDGKVRIGAVGVSGEAPADDAECAETGVRSAGLRSSHS